MLELLFHKLCTTSNFKYAWKGLDEKEVTFLNNLCWWIDLIPLRTFLFPLEGEKIHFPLPILARITLYPLMFLSLPHQSQGLSILMILVKKTWWILDGRYLSRRSKYHHLNKRIWHHVPSAFLIWISFRQLLRNRDKTAGFN